MKRGIISLKIQPRIVCFDSNDIAKNPASTHSTALTLFRIASRLFVNCPAETNHLENSATLHKKYALINILLPEMGGRPIVVKLFRKSLALLKYLNMIVKSKRYSTAHTHSLRNY